MCGIIGIIGKQDSVPLLVEGLRRLEYRGYDSAGIAVLEQSGAIARRRAEGKLTNLEQRLGDDPLSGLVGIGHTRWATHGVPNETNAHPHAAGRVAAVHNGIIENFQEIREALVAKGRVFESETDTESVVHLIDDKLDQGLEPVEAVREALKELRGAFGLGIMIHGTHDMLFAARKGSPLAVGYGDGEMYLGSDALALSHLTKRIAYLEDGDWAVLDRRGVTIHDAAGTPVDRQIHISAMSGAMIGKGAYRHFMAKEIFEQPQVIGDTLNGMFNPTERTITLPDLPFDPKDVERVTLIACGTSFYAGLVGKYWLEKVARLPVELDTASEFRYREPPLRKGDVALFISQSGETADTLAALRHCREAGLHCLSIVNVPESTMARESHAVLQTLAGPEIGVASTKAFTTQLTVLACLAIALARARGAIDHGTEAELCKSLTEVPARIAEVLRHDDLLKDIAETVAEARDVLYLGRGTAFAIAMEGALKLKEISYIHAEGYAAGEMKHGPIALIDERVPVVMLAPSDELFEKTASNVQEVVARGGKVILMTDAEGAGRIGAKPAHTVILPKLESFVAPILYAVPVQLLAYHTAVFKGTDVDQPRNLAKSVTVE
ncbi:MAG: glutamine--fructose-6-phosphate transaminase (isomerizing) [Rhodospirillaceae bacterium]